MTRKKTKRKKVYVRGTGLVLAIEGVGSSPDAHLDSMRMVELQAIDAFARGEAGSEEYSILCCMVALADDFASRGVGLEVKEAVKQAISALDMAQKSNAETGRPAIDDVGQKALRAIYEYHDLQRTSVQRSIYQEVVRVVTARLRSGHHPFVALT